MQFKAAVCPSCGGKMQLSDTVTRVECNYCGVEIVVANAIKRTGRVREFTVAKPIERVREFKPFDVDAALGQTKLIMICVGIGGATIAFVTSRSNVLFGIILGIVFLGMLPVIYFIRTKNLEMIRDADDTMMKRHSDVTVIAYEGLCPYCEATTSIRSNQPGGDCKACKKRIVVRDSRFYSVDTPIST